MDDLPESIRKRLRRLLQSESSARETSEDGDFVTLREVREKHKNKTKNNNAIIKEEDEGIDKRRAPDAEDVPNAKEPARPWSSKSISGPRNEQLETLRDQLFKIVINGSLDEILHIIPKQGSQYQLHSTELLHPINGMNLLHFSLDKGRVDVASLILNNSLKDLAIQEFAMTKGTRTALHQITELNHIKLVKLLLSKFESISEKLEVIKMVTEVAIEGQRPRTFSSFHLAAFKGFTELVNFYLDVGIDIDLLNVKKDTALLWAARWGHDETVKCLLDRNANVNIENDKRSTALHWATRYQFASTVKLLLEEGNADPNHERLLGLVTPLVLACAIGNNTIVAHLLEHKAEVNYKIRGGEVALHHAAKEGHLDVLKTLLTYGADIEIEDEKGDRALNLAASNGYAEIVEELILHGADSSHKNHTGYNAWYYAMTSQDNDVLKVLTKHYIKMSEESGKKHVKSPIIIAASHGMCEKLHTLLKLGVDPSKRDAEGNTFLHHAAIHNQVEVIHKFYKKVQIDSQNNKKETALHIACMKGHYDAALELMTNKARSNIGNLNGENALHITALSPNTTPKLAKAMMEYMIKSHDWESVNATDNIGNNALHLAAIYATPEVLWEFRLVRFKDLDVDGNTPLHEAVRPGVPEILETVLDIYDSMQRDADLNTYNKNRETVLHLAASAGFTDSVSRLVFYGADLTCEDKAGNTVLHRLVKATVEQEDKQRVYMRVVDTIFSESVRWWCIRCKLRYPGDDRTLFENLQRTAILHLVNNYYNHQSLSVLSYAAKLGADKFLYRIMTMPNVMRFQREDQIYFDITHMTPQTNEKRKRCCGGERIAPSPSFVELLVSVDVKDRAASVLDIPPIRQVERMYTSICAWAYSFFLALHILYISFFTFLGITVSQKLRDTTTGTPLSSFDGHVVASYIIAPIEPLIFMTYAIVILYRHFTKKHRIDAGEILNFILILVFSGLVIIWLILIGRQELYQDYVLASALCLGWLFAISFTRGFKGIHYFYRMLLNMLARDVLRFIIVFSFVLLAFSSSFHVLFQISANIANTYPSPGDTIFLMFNLMLGMESLFDDSYENGMSSVGRTTAFSKVVFLMYIVLSTIVLLNLLIAMMNDSYSDILVHQKVTWRVDSVQLGVGVENMFPWFPSVFGRIKIKKLQLHDNIDTNDVMNERYYLVTTEEELKSYEPESKSDSGENIQYLLETNFSELDARMKVTEQNTKLAMQKFDEILRLLRTPEETKQTVRS